MKINMVILITKYDSVCLFPYLLFNTVLALFQYALRSACPVVSPLIVLLILSNDSSVFLSANAFNPCVVQNHTLVRKPTSGVATDSG